MKNIITILTLVLVAGISRLIPHPWNFTAMTAMALFSGCVMPKNQKLLAFLAPLLALLWTDAILGFHTTAVYVYAAVALITIMGMNLKEDSVLQVGSAALIGSGLFFGITNFGVWLSQDMYLKSLVGLETCFAMAVPFFHYQVLGDLFYTGVLFGAFAILRKTVPVLAQEG